MFSLGPGPANCEDNERKAKPMSTRKALEGKSYEGNPHVASPQRYMHRRGEASEGTLPKATRRARKRVRGTGRFDEG